MKIMLGSEGLKMTFVVNSHTKTISQYKNNIKGICPINILHYFHIYHKNVFTNLTALWPIMFANGMVNVKAKRVPFLLVHNVRVSKLLIS